MTFLSVVTTTLYYIFYPIATLLSWILVCISPILHLGQYFLHALLLPLRILGRFETLYIYLGVAVLIGLITGSILYYFNVALISVFDLRPTPSEATYPATSVVRDEMRRQKQRMSLDPMGVATATSPGTTTSTASTRARIDPSMKREYADWLDKDRGRRRDGLLSTTILEEDDSSEDF